MRSLTHGTATLTLTLLLIATMTGCAEDAAPADDPAGGESATATPTETTAAAGADATPVEAEESSPIDGTWLIERTRAQMRADLERHDLGKWAKTFFASEDIDQKVTWLFTFEGDRFDGKFLYPDGSWKSGWFGPLEVTGNRAHLTDEEFGTTDIYRWSVHGERLVFRYVRSTGASSVRGIPEAVYVRAYFSAPLKRTDCPAEIAPCTA